MAKPDQDSRPPVVVVVDDSADLLNALGFALQTEGFEAMTFTSAALADAWAGLKTADFLVVDQNLPGDSGLDFLARLRAAGCRSPAALITTNPPKAVVDMAARVHTPIVEKPLLNGELFALIRTNVAAGRRIGCTVGERP